MIALSRATCPRCGFIVVAASGKMKDELCRAHDWEIHQLPSVDEVKRAFARSDIPRARAVLDRLARRRRFRQAQGHLLKPSHSTSRRTHSSR